MLSWSLRHQETSIGIILECLLYKFSKLKQIQQIELYKFSRLNKFLLNMGFCIIKVYLFSFHKAGCVIMNPPNPPSPNHVKVLLLFFSTSLKAFVGVIPDEQVNLIPIIAFWRKLNVYKTFRRRLMYVQCTSCVYRDDVKGYENKWNVLSFGRKILDCVI